MHISIFHTNTEVENHTTLLADEP